MKCVIQRVRRASVTVGDDVVSEIGIGLLVLAAVEKGDAEQVMRDAAKKIRELRIFSDDAGKMNRDVTEAGGAILAVSQFTLAGSIARGRRPSFDNAEEPERARMMFELFVRELASTGIELGRLRSFGALRRLALCARGYASLRMTMFILRRLCLTNPN